MPEDEEPAIFPCGLPDSVKKNFIMRPLVFPLFFLSPLNSPFSGLYSFALSWSHDCIQPTPVFLLFHLIFFMGHIHVIKLNI